MLGNAEQAEEAVQQMVEAALTTGSPFDGKSTLRTWLTSILTYKCLDSIRRSIRERRQSVPTDLDDLFIRDGHWNQQSAPQDVESLIDQQKMVQFLKDCLTQLTPEQRLIFILGEVDQKTREEICNETALSSTNVGVLAFRARNKLRGCIEKKTIAGAQRES